MVFNHIPTILPELIDFKEGQNRFYITPDGTFPSVTTVLSSIVPKKLLEWQKRRGEEAVRLTVGAASRGRTFHSVLEKYLTNEEVILKDLLPLTKESFIMCRDELSHINNIRVIEKPLYSKRLGVAGKPDLIAEYKGMLAVIDFKTSTSDLHKFPDKINKYLLQCWVYAQMFNDMVGQSPKLGVIICTSHEHGLKVLGSKFKKHHDQFQELFDKYYVEFNNV